MGERISKQFIVILCFIARINPFGNAHTLRSFYTRKHLQHIAINSKCTGLKNIVSRKTTTRKTYKTIKQFLFATYCQDRKKDT